MKMRMAVLATLMIFTGVAHGEGNNYYLKVESVDGKWEFKQISRERLARENKKQEILETRQSDGKSFIPSFEETADWQYVGNYSYKRFSDEPNLVSAITYSCKQRSDTTKYTPCNSSLTGFVNTDFFFLLGNSRFSLKTGELENVVREADLRGVVGSCTDKNLHYAEDMLARKISVVPTIVDNSGFYDNSKLYSLTPRNYDCLIKNKNEIKYDIRYSDSSDFNFEGDLKEFAVCKDGTACVVKPNIIINSKKISSLNVGETFSDRNIEFKLIEVNAGSNGSVVINFDIRNISKFPIEMNQVSLYINNAPIMISLTDKIEPGRKSDNLTKSAYVDSNTRSVLSFNLSKSNANDKLKMDASITYSIDGASKTLTETKYPTLRKLAKL